jgi:hypothetical protein
MSNQLIHFTKGTTDEEAFRRLQSIIDRRAVIGHSDKIKARYPCVCLTEAPLQAMVDGFRNLSGRTEYRLFGVMFGKAWLYARGGRPVIYEPDSEYALLPESHQWRHVRYEPTAAVPIDFTWEREWRIRGPELNFEPSDAAIVVPSSAWRDRLVREFDQQQDYQVESYSTIMDIELAEQYREDFAWRLVVL